MPIYLAIQRACHPLIWFLVQDIPAQYMFAHALCTFILSAVYVGLGPDCFFYVQKRVVFYTSSFPGVREE